LEIITFSTKFRTFPGSGTAEAKYKAFADAGIHISRSPADLGKTMKLALKK
jgi:succinyl-CoA synthetase alpha subunit